MGVFNNLVMYDQHMAQNSLSTIVPDLATAGWDEKTKLTFSCAGREMARRQPFTAADVKCTWDLLTGKARTSSASIRASWYNNIEDVTTNGDHEATFI